MVRTYGHFLAILILAHTLVIEYLLLHGASTYHSGIDIPAPEGTDILSICSGVVTFCSWGAGGGYTIVVENDNTKVSYCHVSPIFIVSRNDIVNVGDVISNVGPKNVYGIENNPYHDSSGNPTNGATTGCHLHLTIKKDGQAVNPLDYFNYISSSSSSS